VDPRLLPRLWRGAAVRFQLSAHAGVHALHDCPDDDHRGPGAENDRSGELRGYQGGAVSPGEILTIFAANYGGFGPASLVTYQLDSERQVPDQPGGVQVLFDGTPAPLVYAEAGQVSAIVPFEVAGEQQTMIQYQYNARSILQRPSCDL
jgi:hypothetical protein